jgi:predicted acylesterase/phospholipase RssA/CRP-like cAMP-binding protein
VEEPARSRVDQLIENDLLRGLGREAIASIEDHIRYLDLDAGTLLVSQGDVADELYLLLSGQLEVVIETDSGPQTLTTLQPGSTVGEIALLAGDRRSATLLASEPSEVAAISEEGFRALLADHPLQAELLARRAVERLRETQLIGQLVQLFGHLEADVLFTIQSLIEWVPVRAGTRLFSQGEIGDAAYLVVTGRLRAFRVDKDGLESEVGEVGRSELVGEMALLDDAPRAATVYAVRDSQLVRFSRAAFEEVLRRYPSAGLFVAQTVLRRQDTASRDGAGRMSIVVVPASPGIDGRAFGRQLAASFGGEARYVSSETIDRDLSLPGISQVGDDDVGTFRLSYWLEELQERHRVLVYGVDETWSEWSRRALRWADQVVVVADATADPSPDALERELWHLVSLQKHPKVSLALVHPPDTTLPSGTRRWLDARQVASHHHLRRDDPVTLGRLARLLEGSGTALVLGGGGARGFAHLGVMVVLEELSLPIDMIGGTSVGAIMAAGPAMGWTAEESRQMATEQFRKVFDYTLPSVSILKGERVASKLRNTFGDIDIVDLWIPYFCVSTNLTTAGTRYHDRGRLADAVRASIAIPGVLPPVPFDGELHVDGGILDNVPVEEMRRRNPQGHVIAVDVAPADGPAAEVDYGLSLSGFRAMIDRRRSWAPPGLLSTMVRATLVASERDRDRVVREQVADLYLDVAVEGGGLLDFSEADKIAASAEMSTRPILRRWVHGSGVEDLGYVRTPAAAGTVLADARRRRKGVGVILLTVRDLQHRAVRFAATIAGTSVVLALLFLMTGLVEQFHLEPRDSVEAFGAEAWLLRDGVSGAFTAAATMPADTADGLDDEAAAPLVTARHSIDGDEPIDVVVIGFEAGALGQPGISRGTLPTSPEEVVVDRTSDLRPGDDLVIGGQRFVVSGNTERTTMFAGMPLVYLEIAAAQDLVYRGEPLATAVLLSEVPETTPEGFVIRSPREIADDALRPLDGAIASINLVRVLLWFVAAMIIGTMIYLSALERRRDVAVLKAVGGSTTQMGGSIALQGALIALAAALIASVLQVALVPVFPLTVTVPSRALVQIPVLAVVVSLVAGAVGLRKAVGTDPALAFSGPGS